MLRLAAFACLLSVVLCHPGWHGGHNETKAPCSPRVNALVAGIQINILGQQGERNATENLQAIEASSPGNATAFAAGKAMLLDDIQFGMKIREYNQELVPPGNAAIPGLAKYAAAQSTELALAESLTGDPSHDAPILSTLVSDITTGIQLNENNTKAAVSKCCTPLVPKFDVPT